MDLSYEEPQTGEKITKTLNEGEFFGLKSSIINHTRDEMVQAITDCIVNGVHYSRVRDLRVEERGIDETAVARAFQPDPQPRHQGQQLPRQ
jgi:CRP-like cAMP-binding protein